MNTQSVSRKKVLIVDDSVDIQELLTILLASHGFDTRCTSNGEEALRVLESTTFLPNLILLDLRMPIMDGIAFLDIQRRSPKLKGIRTIMMTAEDDLDSLICKTSLFETLAKPLSMTSLLDAVHRGSVLH